MKKIASRYVVKLCLLMAPVWSIGQQPAFAEPGASGDSEIPELDCVIEPSAIVDAGSSVPGLIETINVDRSDLIAAGDVLAKLESSVESAALKRARAQATTNTNIKLREESLKLGKITEKRNAELMQISAISKQDMEQLQTESRIAELQVKQEKHNKRVAQLEYQRAKAALERLTIRSPIEGVVTDRFKAIGEYVEDEPVLRIAQIDPLFVEVVVPVDYLGAISAGMQAEVFPGAAGLASHIATVERVDRVADAASGTYGVRLSLDNPDYTIPAGLRCKLAFLSPEQADLGRIAETTPAAPVLDQSHWVLDPTADKDISANDNATSNEPLVAEIAAAQPQVASQVSSGNETNATEPSIPVASENVTATTDVPDTVAITPEPATALIADNDTDNNTDNSADKISPIDPANEAQVPPVDLAAVLLQAALATKDSPTTPPANFVSPIAAAENQPTNKMTAMNSATREVRDMCYSIGPVATERLAHQLVNQVSEHIQTPTKSSLMKRLRDEKKVVTNGYYVLANSGESDQQVGEYLDRLNKAGIADHMLINRGSNKGRISLGYFHRQSSANERLKLMLEKGFNAEIIKRTGTTQKYWLDFNGPDQSELKNNLQEIAGGITPDASLQSRDCSAKVASR